MRLVAKVENSFNEEHKLEEQKFLIVDEDGFLPTMYFEDRETMNTIFDFLQTGKMRFKVCLGNLTYPV